MNPSEVPHDSFKLPQKKAGEQGFKAPEGYFGDFAARLQTRLQLEDHPESPDPQLTGLDRENIYSAPDGYFEGLHRRIMARINGQEETGKVRQLSWYQRPALQWAVAAAVTLLVVVGIALNGPSQTQGFDDFSTEELLAMVESEQVEAALILEVMGTPGPEGFSEDELGEWGESELDLLLDEVDLKDLEAALLEEQN